MAKKTAKKTSRKTSRKTPRKTATGRKKGTGTGSTRSTKQETPQTGPMSLPLLEQLVKLMSANELTTIELQDGQQRIVLNRGGQVISVPQAAAPPAPAPTPAPAAASPASAGSTSTPSAGDPASTAGLVEIKSPMVGTFYDSPSPDAKAFVQVGDKVGPESDVCIIEAMKVFNNIKAETSGTIEKVLVENGSAVEYGQALFLVKPA